MGKKMSNQKEFSISWTAPILPSFSLAGIPLGATLEDLNKVIDKYLINEQKAIYQFLDSPMLYMSKKINENGDGGYGFEVQNVALTNWSLFFQSPNHFGVNKRALSILIRSGKVYAIKVWQFESLLPDQKPINSYKGRLPEGVGLGDYVRDILVFTELNFDSDEEWFCTDKSYGTLEVTGLGNNWDLNDDPDQRITALAVVGN